MQHEASYSSTQLSAARQIYSSCPLAVSAKQVLRMIHSNPQKWSLVFILVGFQRGHWTSHLPWCLS